MRTQNFNFLECYTLRYVTGLRIAAGARFLTFVNNSGLSRDTIAAILVNTSYRQCLRLSKRQLLYNPFRTPGVTRAAFRRRQTVFMQFSLLIQPVQYRPHVVARPSSRCQRLLGFAFAGRSHTPSSRNGRHHRCHPAEYGHDHNHRLIADHRRDLLEHPHPLPVHQPR